MTNKAPFCSFLWLSITILSRQIRSLPVYQVSLWSLLTYQVGQRNPFTPLETCFLFLMGRNLWLIKDLCLYNCRDTFTHVMSALQIHLFMQNKAKFRKVKLSVTIEMKKDYVQMDTWSIRKKQSQTKPNKAKQSQNEPNFSQ